MKLKNKKIKLKIANKIRKSYGDNYKQLIWSIVIDNFLSLSNNTKLLHLILMFIGVRINDIKICFGPTDKGFGNELIKSVIERKGDIITMIINKKVNELSFKWIVINYLKKIFYFFWTDEEVFEYANSLSSFIVRQWLEKVSKLGLCPDSEENINFFLDRDNDDHSLIDMLSNNEYFTEEIVSEFLLQSAKLSTLCRAFTCLEYKLEETGFTINKN